MFDESKCYPCLCAQCAYEAPCPNIEYRLHTPCPITRCGKFVKNYYERMEDIPMQSPEGWSLVIYNRKSNTLTFEVPESEVDPKFLKYFKEAHGIPTDVECIFRSEEPVEGGV